MKQSVLITGASGFVGGALARTLVLYGSRTVVSMVRDRTRTPPGDAVVHGDVTDHDFCRRTLADYEVSTVFHLAAQSIVSMCAEDPISALAVAVLGTARLLQAARDVGRKIRFVVMTSDKVYGSSPSPYTESTPLDARHSYEVSKACQDLVARMFYSNYKVDVRVVRAVNIYGPGDPNDTRLVPQTVQRMLQGRPPLLHAGSEGMRRQYLYVDDIVRALLKIESDGAPGGVYCVGSPDPPMSVQQVMREIMRQLGVEAQPEVRERGDRFLEIQEQAADDRKLRGIGWEPRVSFAEGVARTIAWYRSRRADQ